MNNIDSPPGGETADRKITIWIPDMRYQDGTPESFKVDDTPLTLEQVNERGGWSYVLHQVSDFDEMEQGFLEMYFENKDLCLEEQAEDHPEDCAACLQAHDERLEWVRANMLGVARWARHRWPGLVIDADELEGLDLAGPLYGPGETLSPWAPRGANP